MMKVFCVSFLIFNLSAAVASTEKLPIPRFVSLRSNKVNSHVGPGPSFPVDWTYLRQHFPVEIIAEFDTWRQIRDTEGSTGWIHKSLLCGKRTAIVQGKRRRIFSKPDLSSTVVAHLDPGVIGYLKECKNDWCRIDVKGYVGWIKRRNLWGVYPHEVKF